MGIMGSRRVSDFSFELLIIYPDEDQSAFESIEIERIPPQAIVAAAIQAGRVSPNGWAASPPFRAAPS
jgi:hypothetical protein